MLWLWSGCTTFLKTQEQSSGRITKPITNITKTPDMICIRKPYDKQQNGAMV